VTVAILVFGRSAAAREQAVADALKEGPPGTVSIILEGLPDGTDRLAAAAATMQATIVRIAPGCICCTGNLPMRVTLNRLLRARPERLFIGVADARHVDGIRAFLSQPPYDALLTLSMIDAG